MSGATETGAQTRRRADGQLDGWREQHGVVAGITDRSAGSLGLSASDSAEVVMNRFRDFRAALKPRFTAHQMAHQVHGAAVAWHEDVAPGLHVRDDVDAHVTTQPGLLLSVTVADCVPIYLTAGDGRAVAMVHAGWRGTAAGVLAAAVGVLRERAKVLPGELVMHCGVAICGDCYEVGEEVARAVLGRDARAGKQTIDLRAALSRQGEALGIRDITISPLCTRCDNDRFFSHRANGDGGRQIAYLGKPLP